MSGAHEHDRWQPFFFLAYPTAPRTAYRAVTVARVLIRREGEDAAVVAEFTVRRVSWVGAQPWEARARFLGHPLLPGARDKRTRHETFEGAADFLRGIVRRVVVGYHAARGLLVLPWDDETRRAVERERW